MAEPIGLPRRILFWVRRAVLLLSLLGILWLVSRFRAYGLSGEAAILPMRFEPGQTLLIDQRPRPPVVGDAWFVRTPDGALALGIVQALSEEAMAMLFGRAGFDAEHWIWIPKDQAQARVLFALPF